jgi:hypothetical protein
MAYYKVNIESLSGRFGKTFKSGDTVTDFDFQPNTVQVLLFKGFITTMETPRAYGAPPPIDKKNGLKIYQIYYEENQFNKLNYTPYLNDNCTKYFESQVMVDLINAGAHNDYSYFGVVSHKLREKLSFAKTYSIVNIANRSVNEFTPEMFEFELWNQLPDAFSFQRHLPHDPILFADKFHSNFSDYFKKIMNEIGYSWTPTLFDNVFYCNYFVARSEIYEHFVKTMLEPAIEIMEQMPELLKNSGYPKKLPLNLLRKWGFDYYPYHAFLCERMFSYYAHLNKLRCLHY